MISNLQSILSTAESVGGTRTFGRLNVRERVLDTGDRTIAVANISTVSLAKLDKKWTRIVLWILAALCGASGLFSLVGGDVFSSILALALAGLFGWLAYRAKNILTLSLGTNDGARTLFSSTDEAFLSDVKRFLTDKINTGDLRAATFVFDHSKQDISIGKVVTGNDHSVNADSVVTGSHNQVATNSAGAQFGNSETRYSAVNSPKAQVGAGNTVARVDYSSVLPNVEEWRRQAAQSPGWEHVAERLGELETLLKSGTPNAEGKGKVRSLVSDLSGILQAYPAAAQLFQSIARLAGA
ncbi:hypothetical protein W911_01240 [Hyphomicrobium nitrativorans NL23]|uniref:Uncharacterized protein n=1 Tax=Hyphomicrobium nitrativorans NL23 TaxID=1029756 RepID=V5SIR7_9HYPH|nr:DUF6232 family protein [Hyphomicrobium nitrativorans]AHB49819.1 hypothetical protein W911_01240 [Hyphomicrobium nitrativorans NL23]